MEFDEAHDNLRAIRLLYKLLHDNNNLLLQNEYEDSEHQLIERARGLLKSLLDVAVVSVFQTHLKIIATPAGISSTSSFDQEKHMAMLQFESPVAVNNPQSSVKDPTLSEMPSSQEDEQPHLRLIPEKEFPSSISDNGGANSIGEENRMMKHDLVKATGSTYENGTSPNKESSNYEQQHNHVDAVDGVGEQAKESLRMLEDEVKNMPLLSTIDELQYSSSAASHVESSDQKGDFSDDLLNSMKRIESRMFALQLCSNLADSTKSNADHQTMNEEATSDSANMQGKDEITVSQNHRLHSNAVSAKSKNDAPNQNRTQGLNKVKSLNRLVGGNTYLRTQASDHIQDLKVPLNQDDLTRKPSNLSGHRNRKILVRKNPVVWSETDHNQKKMSPEHSYTQNPVRSTGSNVARRQKPQPHQMVIRPTLLDQKSSEIKVTSHHRREGSVHVEPWKTRVQPQHQELEESSSNSQSSSSWTSQQGSDNNSSSNSEDYSLPSGTEDNSTSGTMVDAAYEGSSEESNNSYTSNDDDDDDNSSCRFGSMKSHRYYPKRNPERKIGGLKRLKNKLGLIFHHHHHHHHHHYDNDDDDDDSSIQSKRSHNKHSMWNNLQHVFHQKNKHKLLTNGKVDKTKRRKGVSRAVVPRGNQVGQFHRLVKGLLRHMRHSKKKKGHKLGEMKGSRDTQKHGRHGKKKLHWWQMLQQHRGVKMQNRGKVKVGFISQKSPKRLA